MTGRERGPSQTFPTSSDEHPSAALDPVAATRLLPMLEVTVANDAAHRLKATANLATLATGSEKARFHLLQVLLPPVQAAKAAGHV